MFEWCLTSAFFGHCFSSKYHISCIFSKTTQHRELKLGVYMPHKKMHTILCCRLHLLPLLPSYLRIKAILHQQSITLELLGIEAWSFFQSVGVCVHHAIILFAILYDYFFFLEKTISSYYYSFAHLRDSRSQQPQYVESCNFFHQLRVSVYMKNFYV